jgi:NADH-quinone oxidoreductase subunit N
MSLLYGIAGTTSLSGIAAGMSVAGGEGATALKSLAIVFVVVGFAFKVSAVPFHTWAPDTYEGAPTPVTAFLAVASKTAGFVALTNVVILGFAGRPEVLKWMLVPLAAITMTVGNLIAIRQTNVIRMLAYSGVAQAGYMLCPLAVATSLPDPNQATRSLLVYLVIYAAMNLGAFGVVMAVARRTGSGEIASMKGMFHWAPGMMLALSIFLGGFAGIPPAGGWFGKFVIFKSTMDAGAAPDVGSASGYFLALLIGVNSVIAAFYYVRVIWTMVSHDADDVPQTPLRSPAALRAAVFITAVVVVATGVLPTLVSNITDTATLVSAARP